MKKLERVNQVEKAAIRLYMANRDFTAFTLSNFFMILQSVKNARDCYM